MLNLKYKWNIAESYTNWFTSVNNLSDNIVIGWIFLDTIAGFISTVQPNKTSC